MMIDDDRVNFGPAKMSYLAFHRGGLVAAAAAAAFATSSSCI
jgi:hypothetical protein